MFLKLMPYHTEYQEDGFMGRAALVLTKVAYSNYSMRGEGWGRGGFNRMRAVFSQQKKPYR